MKNVSPSSQSTVGALLLIYWIPLVVLSIYASPRKGWTLLLTGLFLSIIGAICFWLLMRQREQSIESHIQSLKNSLPKEPETPPPSKPPPNKVDEEKLLSLQKTIEAHERKELENRKLIEDKQHLLFKTVKENEQYQLQVENLNQELDTVKNYLDEQVTHYEGLLIEHQKTIAELRDSVQSKQQVAMQLESKVRDLSYEIKTILQIAEGPQEATSEKPQVAPPKESTVVIHDNEDGQIHSFEEALMLLKRCLDSAQRMPGASHFAKSQRFKDIPFENYALDLRRLFDHFQHEADGILFVYSQQEEKMLFVTDHIANLLGIDGEKLIKTFQEIIYDSKGEWNRALSQLSFKNESKVILSMKTRTGQEIPVTCVLSAIPTGPFRNHVLGVLFSDVKNSMHGLLK